MRSRLIGTPSATGSPAVAGYEPTACQIAVECHTLKRCTPDRGPASDSYFVGLGLSTYVIEPWIKARIMI